MFLGDFGPYHSIPKISAQAATNKTAFWAKTGPAFDFGIDQSWAYLSNIR